MLKNGYSLETSLSFIICRCAMAIGTLFFMLAVMPAAVYANEVNFRGSGTKEDPYLIEDATGLKQFRDLVNEGDSFDYTYFRQTNDIDLKSESNWIPIGEYGSDHYFYGFYDGTGHTISNLTIYPKDDVSGNVGLFGVLCGEVRNLGIESGTITGACVGAIASHGASCAAIINCYNKASVNGVRAGGIADNFQGQILFCMNLGQVTSSEGVAGGILSYTCKEVRYCYSTGDNPLVTDNFTGEIKKSSLLKTSDINRSFLKKMYQNIREYEDDSVDSGTMCRLVLKGSNLEYVRNSDINRTSAFFSLSSGVVLAAMLGAVIALDYFANGRKEHKSGR